MRATTKLVIYTLVGSLLMLAGAVATGVLAREARHITFVLSELQQLPLGRGSQEWIFLLFAAAFLVKMPAFPLHGWMPDGYRAMPIAGAGRLLGRALEGRRLRLPARSCCRCSPTPRCTSRR